MKDYDYYDDEYESNDEKEDNFDLASVLSFIATWFIRIGMVIAVILFAVFLFSGKVMTALFYIIGLIVAFFFGYAIMFLIDYFSFND